jgi:predicted O-methyltransferase YrrM
MKPTRILKDSVSLGSFLRTIGSLKGDEQPAAVVDIAMGCKAILPNQTRSEIIQLLDLVRKNNCRYVMEIGTYRGGTLFLFSRMADAKATVISVDYPMTFMGHLYRILQGPILRRFASRGQSIFLLRNNSHKLQTVDSVRKILNGRKLDFLFIDGDHSYEGVKQDFEMYKGLVKEGGFLAFHDICPGPSPSIQVSKLWQELKGQFNVSEFIDASAGHTAGIGVVWV